MSHSPLHPRSVPKPWTLTPPLFCPQALDTHTLLLSPQDPGFLWPTQSSANHPTPFFLILPKWHCGLGCRPRGHLLFPVSFSKTTPLLPQKNSNDVTSPSSMVGLRGRPTIVSPLASYKDLLTICSVSFPSMPCLVHPHLLPSQGCPVDSCEGKSTPQCKDVGQRCETPVPLQEGSKHSVSTPFTPNSLGPSPSFLTWMDLEGACACHGFLL